MTGVILKFHNGMERREMFFSNFFRGSEERQDLIQL